MPHFHLYGCVHMSCTQLKELPFFQWKAVFSSILLHLKDGGKKYYLTHDKMLISSNIKAAHLFILICYEMSLNNFI